MTSSSVPPNSDLPVLIRRLAPPDAAAFQALRMTALRTCPTAFSSSYEEECDTTLATREGQLAAGSGRNFFGAFIGDALIGMVGVGREQALKVRHKGYVRAMYVAAAHSGKGIGRRLLAQALDFAATMEGLRHVGLSVTAGNDNALALYASMGFSVVGREPGALLVDGVFYDDVQMVRSIDAGPAIGTA